MMRSLFAVLVWSVLSSACVYAPVQDPMAMKFRDLAPALPGAERGVASSPAPEQNPVWTQHPCRDQKGVPFRKYRDFALDARSGKIIAHLATGESVTELAQAPKGKDAWTSVDEFFAESGIAKACGAVTSTSPSPAPENQEAPSRKKSASNQKVQSLFVAPIKENPMGNYYAAMDSYANLQKESGKETDLAQLLSVLLSSPHVQTPGQNDVLVESCATAASRLEKNQVCVTSLEQGYTEAREKLMGDLDLRLASGGYEIFDHYCQLWLDEKRFKDEGVNSSFPAPHAIVHPRVINCEHTWPQSKFTAPKGQPENEREKTDMHHLFSTSAKLNNLRANYEFGDVDRKSDKTKGGLCAGVASEAVLGPAIPVEGIEASSAPVFEPPKAHKGHVARALFYFAIRYHASMSKAQEHFLRVWHKEEPPDEAEIRRSERIYQLSGVRNPFVDHPEYVEQIPSF